MLSGWFKIINIHGSIVKKKVHSSEEPLISSTLSPSHDQMELATEQL